MLRTVRMVSRRFLCVVVLLVGVLGATAGLAAAGAVSWGTAVEVPGTAALNTGYDAVTNSVACASAGNCAAGGSYADAHGYQAFVVSEKNGVWGNAVEVPGTGSLNVGDFAEVDSVSCASVGGCSAGGLYRDQYRHWQAFVVSQKNGVWGNATEVPLPNLNNADLVSVSCRGAGNCSAGGYYGDASGQQAFVVSEVNGVWKSPLEVPGTAALNNSGGASTLSVSCAKPGNCVAGGYYSDGSSQQAWVASQKNGVWGNAVEVPNTAALDVGGNASTLSVSCSTSGNCSAGGYYSDRRGGGTQRAFVATQRNGTWGKAVAVPGLATLNVGDYARVSSVSCVATLASPSNCSAGGWHTDVYGHQMAFVVSEKSGKWSSARSLPIFNHFNAAVTSVSCSAAGNCAAVGYYDDNTYGQPQGAVVAGERNWIWGHAVKVLGSASAAVSVSCVTTGKCSIGGAYFDSSSNLQAFVTSP